MYVHVYTYMYVYIGIYVCMYVFMCTFECMLYVLYLCMYCFLCVHVCTDTNVLDCDLHECCCCSCQGCMCVDVFGWRSFIVDNMLPGTWTNYGSVPFGWE